MALVFFFSVALVNHQISLGVGSAYHLCWLIRIEHVKRHVQPAPVNSDTFWPIFWNEPCNWLKWMIHNFITNFRKSLACCFMTLIILRLNWFIALWSASDIAHHDLQHITDALNSEPLMVYWFIVDLLYKLWIELKHGTKRSFETCGGMIDWNDSLSQGLLVDSKSTHVSGTWSTINCPSTSTRPLAWSWDGETLGFQGFSGFFGILESAA